MRTEKLNSFPFTELEEIGEAKKFNKQCTGLIHGHE